jgi:hypothetical protein
MKIVIYDILYALDIVSFIIAVVMIVSFIVSIVRDKRAKHRKKVIEVVKNG